MNYTIILRLSATSISGQAPLCLRLIIDRKTKLYTLPIKIKPQDWNEAKTQVKKTDPLSDFKNKVLNQWRFKADAIKQEALLFDQNVTFESFDFQFKERTNKASFEDFARKLIEERKNTYSKETLRSYKSYLTKLKQFRNDLSFKDINNLAFIKSYEYYMRNEIDNQTNTVWKSLSYFKAVLNEAKKRKLIKNNAFEGYPLKKVDGNREFLTISELEKLEALLNNKSLSTAQLSVLKYFLFSCYTGLRYGDLNRLTYANIIIKDNFSEGKVENKYYLKITPQKTANSSGKEVSNPLIKKAVQLLELNSEPNEKIFKIISGDKTRKHIKNLVKIAGINKNITTHCARHTFATMLLTKGANIAVVSKLLGHSSIKTTMIYAKVVDSAKVDAMDLLE